MMNRDDEMIVCAEIVEADYSGMSCIKLRLEKDNPWDPLTVLKTYFKGEIQPDVRNLNGMTLGEAKEYIDWLSRH